MGVGGFIVLNKLRKNMPHCLSKLSTPQRPSNTTINGAAAESGNMCEMKCPFFTGANGTLYLSCHVHHSEPAEDLPDAIKTWVATQPRCIYEVVMMGDFNTTSHSMQVPEDCVLARGEVSQLSDCRSEYELPQPLYEHELAMLAIVRYLVTDPQFNGFSFSNATSNKAKRATTNVVVDNIFCEDAIAQILELEFMLSDHPCVVFEKNGVFMLSWNVMGGRCQDLLSTIKHYLMKDAEFLKKTYELFPDNEQGVSKQWSGWVAAKIATRVSLYCTPARCKRVMEIIYSRVAQKERWIVALQECPNETIEGMQAMCNKLNALFSGEVHRNQPTFGENNIAAMCIAGKFEGGGDTGQITLPYSPLQNTTASEATNSGIID